jgi:hypothetical protein
VSVLRHVVCGSRLVGGESDRSLAELGNCVDVEFGSQCEHLSLFLKLRGERE